MKMQSQKVAGKLVFSCESQTTRTKVISIVYALVEAYSVPKTRLQKVPW